MMADQISIKTAELEKVLLELKDAGTYTFTVDLDAYTISVTK